MHEEVVSFIDEGHCPVISACVGMESLAHYPAPAIEVVGINFVVQVEQLPVGFFFIPGAQFLNAGEEMGGKSGDLSFKTAVVNFHPELLVGYIPGNEEENIPFVESGEPSQGLESLCYTGVAHPEYALAIQKRSTGDLEFKAVNCDLGQDLHGLHVKTGFELMLYYKLWPSKHIVLHIAYDTSVVQREIIY